ncbi:MAG: phospholipid carrier-dependent glycosyltransferase [Candidatus Competibacteraceae bacterium]|nr:phospholipid carrier-dependent glycosyltransferase [Candidatus Competibacteraceae bacterium]
MQSAAVSIASAAGLDDAKTTIWLYRIPSLLGAISIVLLTYWAALALVSRNEAFASGIMMASSILLGVEARLAKTDAVLVACAVVMFGVLARVYTMRRSAPAQLGLVYAFWIAASFAILVKGPIIPLIVILAIAGLWWRERSFEWLWPVVRWRPIALAALIVVPWFAAIIWRSGGDFIAQSLGEDMLAKVSSAQESNAGWPGSYLLAFALTFWPASILAILAIPFVWINRRDETLAFCLAWLVPAWLMFELVPTKLPHYVLPLLPAVAIMTAMALSRGEVFLGLWTGKRFWLGWRRIFGSLLPSIPIGLIAIAIAGTYYFEGLTLVAFLPLLLVGLPFLLISVVLLHFTFWRMPVASMVDRRFSSCRSRPLRRSAFISGFMLGPGTDLLPFASRLDLPKQRTAFPAMSTMS